jgi:hypothetical protein
MPDDNGEPFDPAHPERPHDDFAAVTRAADKLAASLARYRELDGLGATAEAERERLELCDRIADLIECGAPYIDVAHVLGTRHLARKRAGRKRRR